jgi:hypothetical protein
LISAGPMIVSIPYPTAYPEYFGIEIQACFKEHQG